MGLAAAALVISGISSANGGSGAAGGSTSAGGGGAGGTAAGTGAGGAHAALPGTHVLPTTGAEGTAAGGGGSAPVTGPGTNVAAGGWHPPGFTEFFSALQGIAISGMYSLNYPSAYRSFTQNVGWSTGMITWAGMQTSIDNFRNNTGGNLTASSYERLQQSTLVYRNADNQNQTDISIDSTTSSSVTKRMFDELFIRDTNSTSTNTTSSSNSTLTNTSTSSKKYVTIVTGIRAYVEKLSVPSTNTFMTLLIWFAIIVGICIAAVLALKLFLEIWSIKGNPHNKFPGFRKRYHVLLAISLVRLVMLFYGIWVLYCFYQFKLGDSWGTQLLAGLVFGIATIVLIAFSIRIIWLARIASKTKGGLEYLFQHKPWIRKYGLFYDQFKVKYWWCFIPTLLAVFGRNAFVALGYGNGLVQVIGQMVIDVMLTALYVVCLPFNTKMGNGINIAIQVVRVISLAMLLTFAVQFDLNQIATTGIGMALLVVQAVLAILLIVLILINAGAGIFKMTCNGMRKKRKLKKQLKREEKLRLDEANATPREFFEYDEKNPQQLMVPVSDMSGSNTSNDSSSRASTDLRRLSTPTTGNVNPKTMSSSLARVRTDDLLVGSIAKQSFESERSSRPTTIRRVESPELGSQLPLSSSSPINFSRPTAFTTERQARQQQGFASTGEANKEDTVLNARPSKRHLLGHEQHGSGGSELETSSLESPNDSSYDDIEVDSRNIV